MTDEDLMADAGDWLQVISYHSDSGRWTKWDKALEYWTCLNQYGMLLKLITKENEDF